MGLPPINYPFLQDPRAPQISGCLERIVEKKINNVSLSCFEAIAHWFLLTFSCFYPTYSRLYDYNTERVPATISNDPIRRELPRGLKFEDKDGLLSGFADKDERIHQFTRYNHSTRTKSYDGTAVLDLTAQKIASITKKDGRGDFTIAHPVSGEVMLNDRPVVFKPTHGEDFGFGKTRGTAYLTVEDFDGHPGQVKITEHRTEGQSNHWIVDTNKKYQQKRGVSIECRPGPWIEWTDPVYVTEDAILGIRGPYYLIQEEP